jgi:D-glycerate 3-kinase
MKTSGSISLGPELIDAFITKHRLPASFRLLIDDHYGPLLAWIEERIAADSPMLLGINGAQGSGKSTLADFISFALTDDSRAPVAVLSIDDFYLTRGERERLADEVHPLLKTRGVPGTHDTRMLAACLDDLRNLAAGEKLALPRFDKAADDRADPTTWPAVTGPIDLIVLEGWCVGSLAQAEVELTEPINDLERERDPDGRWRRHANEQLAGPYRKLFEQLDALVFLAVPGFDAVYRWRLEQEQKLADTADGRGIMDETGLVEFIRHFERITRANLESMPARADAILYLDDDHDCTRSAIATQRSNSLK